jgi:hypothetical protein
MTQTTTPDPAIQLPPPPQAARWGTLALSAVLGISSLPVLWLAVFAGDAVLWFSAVFELLVLGSAVVGLLAGLGRFRDGWGLALACVAGTSLVVGVFAFIELRANFNTNPSYAGLLKPYLAARIAMAAGFGLLASLAVFSRNTACWRALVKGLIVLAPAAGITVWLATRGAAFLGATRATPGAEAARILMLCLGGLVFIGLISVGCHLLIRAYELGRAPADRTAPVKA